MLWKPKQVSKKNCRREIREVLEQALMGSSRWNPTPEQLLALEEMYRQGTRTPATDEIHQIAAQLRRFGKIEGKNVFYWFQNHKARERQKRRRELETVSEEELVDDDPEILDRKESGFGRTVYGEEQAKNLGPPSNFSNNYKHSEEPLYIKAAAAIAEINTHGVSSSQFERKELKQMRIKSLDKKKNAMWLTRNLTSSSAIHLKNTRITSNLQKPKRENQSDDRDGEINNEVETLQLFPLCTSDDDDDDDDDGGTVSGTKNKDIKVLPIRTININFSPNQFFEFLPLKN